MPLMMVSALLQSLRPQPQGREALNLQTLSLARAAALPAAMHLGDSVGGNGDWMLWPFLAAAALL